MSAPSSPVRIVTARQRRKRRALVAVGVLAAVIVVLGIALAGTWWQTFIRPATTIAAGRPVSITVAPGMGSVAIGELLASKGVVDNAAMFRWKVRQAGVGGELKAGSYELTTGIGYDGAIAALQQGPVVTYTTVTIPEGFVLDQIAARFEAEAGIPSAEFLALAKGGAGQFATEHPYLAGAYQGSLEGFLFPKTYRVKEGATAKDVIEMMLDQFDREVANVNVSAGQARGLTLPQLVTVASIIEREAKVATERPLVSSVIYNRLGRKMNLQMCSTVDYVLPGDHFRLTIAQTKIDTPYNTYKYPGLTPGPISNPGLASLKAAVEPADTDYLYYVLTGKDGSHTFARTSAEFEKARAKSKQVFGE